MANRPDLGGLHSSVYNTVRPPVVPPPLPNALNANWTPPCAQQSFGEPYQFWKTQPPPPPPPPLPPPPPPVFPRPPSVQNPTFPNNPISDVANEPYYGIRIWQKASSATLHENSPNWKYCSSVPHHHANTLAVQNSTTAIYNSCTPLQEYVPISSSAGKLQQALPAPQSWNSGTLQGNWTWPLESKSQIVSGSIPVQESWNSENQTDTWTWHTGAQQRRDGQSLSKHEDGFTSVRKQRDERRLPRSQKHIRFTQREHRTSVLCQVKISAVGKHEGEFKNSEKPTDDKRSSGDQKHTRFPHNETRTNVEYHASHSNRKSHRRRSNSVGEKKNVYNRDSIKSRSTSLTSRIRKKRDRLREHLRNETLQQESKKKHARSRSQERKSKVRGNSRRDSSDKKPHSPDTREKIYSEQILKANSNRGKKHYNIDTKEKKCMEATLKSDSDKQIRHDLLEPIDKCQESNLKSNSIKDKKHHNLLTKERIDEEPLLDLIYNKDNNKEQILDTGEKKVKEQTLKSVYNKDKKHYKLDAKERKYQHPSLELSSIKNKKHIHEVKENKYQDLPTKTTNIKDKKHYRLEAKENKYQEPSIKSSSCRYNSRSRSRSREDYSRHSKEKDFTCKSSKIKSHSHHSKHDKVRWESSSPQIIRTSDDDEDSQDDIYLLHSEALWIRSSPAELYYERSAEDPRLIVGTAKLKSLHEHFQSELIERATRVKALKPKYEPPPRKTKLRIPKPPKTDDASSSSSSDESESDDEEDNALEELERKKKHPDRLHKELWYNDPGEMNDGPVCRCSAKARRSGIRHGIYTGEPMLPLCDYNSNNTLKLHHYRITMSPHTNFLTKYPTTIKHDGHEFIFEGFSMFSHSRLEELPTCKVIRFNIEYAILYIEEKFPDNFTIEGLELFSLFLFHEILELVDLDWKAHDDPTGCPRFHFMPRFARALEDNGKELLSMNVVLQYLLNSNQPLVQDDQLPNLISMSQYEWQDFADEVKGMIVTCPGMKPCSLRVDQLDKEQCNLEKRKFPEIVHFGVRPPQLSYTGNPSYQKAWRDYVKFRHLLANKPKVMYYDRHKLLQKEMKLQEMRMKNNLKRDVTVVVSSKNFYRTGVMCDIVQHAMLLPVLVCHLRFHQSLDLLEKQIGHKFHDRYLLQCALTHPSYRENFGTNPDHARNSLTNCGIRQPEYGDRRIHYLNTRKRGINTLINIMSRFGQHEETASSINHNERLEFLGDAVVEFLSSIHLFFLFPDLEEGGLATYRAAIVQNQHLAVLAKKLQLEKFMLYAHGSDLCHDLELRHAMANCFEALMGALFLDNGIEVADQVFSETLFTEPELLDVWVNYPPHPLQEQEPDGDRKWIKTVPLLKKLREFEEAIGIEFTHIRLLARAFTHCSVGYNNLTLGSNQRLEFLGDTVLQLVASEYLYKYFPEHHEGHLSLLRSSLVNNRTQAVVCDDLNMVEYAIYPYPIGDLKTKDRADLLEAFLGSLYVDKGLDYCQVFCEVCFFPRLQDFIMNQDWNDPKSKLQQCCLTLRTMDGGEPDIPVYKVIECKGPTNTRVYKVAVYFRERRLACGAGHSIQQAEMVAAGNALESSKSLFPQLIHQKRVIQRSLKQQSKHSRTSRER